MRADSDRHNYAYIHCATAPGRRNRRLDTSALATYTTAGRPVPMPSPMAGPTTRANREGAYSRRFCRVSRIYGPTSTWTIYAIHSNFRRWGSTLGHASAPGYLDSDSGSSHWPHRRRNRRTNKKKESRTRRCSVRRTKCAVRRTLTLANR